MRLTLKKHYAYIKTVVPSTMAAFTLTETARHLFRSLFSININDDPRYLISVMLCKFL